MASVALSLVSPTGTVLPLASSPWDTGTHRVLSSTTGLGLPATQAYMAESAGDGRRVTNVRTAGRQIQLSIGIHGSHRQEVADAIDELADAVSYSEGLPLPRLRATYDSGEAREIECFHVSGGEEGMTELGELTATIHLVLEAPTGWWVAKDATAFVVSQADDGQGFLESLPNVWLQTSSAFGDLTLRNPGRAPSRVDWEMHGPFTRVEAVLNGQRWVLEDVVGANESVYLEHTPAGVTVTDNTGASRYRHLNDTPNFWRVPPGESKASVVVTGATPSTKIIGRFRPQFRQVF